MYEQYCQMCGYHKDDGHHRSFVITHTDPQITAFPQICEKCLDIIKATLKEDGL